MNETTIAGTWLLPDQPSAGRSLDQPHHCVVALLKEFGELGDRCPPASGIARHAEKELVLLGRYAGIARRPFAEAKIATKLVTKPGEATKPGGIRNARAG